MRTRVFCILQLHDRNTVHKADKNVRTWLQAKRYISQYRRSGWWWDNHAAEYIMQKLRPRAHQLRSISHGPTREILSEGVQCASNTSVSLEYTEVLRARWGAEQYIEKTRVALSSPEILI